jgi:hypothetical protein
MKLKDNLENRINKVRLIKIVSLCYLNLINLLFLLLMSIKIILLISCLALTYSGHLNMLRSMLHFMNFDIDIKFSNEDKTNSIRFMRVTNVYSFKNSNHIYFDLKYKAEGSLPRLSTVRVRVKSY